MKKISDKGKTQRKIKHAEVAKTLGAEKADEKKIKIPPKLQKELGIKHIYGADKLLVLLCLYFFTHHILNQKQLPASLSNLGRIIGMKEKKLSGICEELAKEGIAEIIKIKKRPYYRLTGRGKIVADFLVQIIKV